MSFFKQLFNNWLGGGHHGYGGYSKHGSPYYGPSYGPTGQGPSSTNSCPKCSASNPTGARFCQQCGNPIGSKMCSNCNAQLAADAKFCNQCGKQQ